jgi:fructose-1-phosphate kinase PfkB-like protein
MKAFSVGAGDWLLGCLVAKVDNGLGMLAALSLAVEAATKSVGEVWVGASCEQL